MCEGCRAAVGDTSAAAGVPSVGQRMMGHARQRAAHKADAEYSKWPIDWDHHAVNHLI